MRPRSQKRNLQKCLFIYSFGMDSPFHRTLILGGFFVLLVGFFCCLIFIFFLIEKRKIRRGKIKEFGQELMTKRDYIFIEWSEL